MNFKVIWIILERNIVKRNILKVFKFWIVVRMIIVKFVVGLFIFSWELLNVLIMIFLMIFVIIFENKGVLEVNVIFKYRGIVIRNIIILVGILDFR